MRPERNTGESRRSVQQSDLQERELGTGSPTSADKSVGADNARWASIDLSGGGAVGSEREFDVPHDLGEAPATCELVEWENATTPATYLVARPVRKEAWSHSHAIVRIWLVAGSFDGTSARFLVRGVGGMMTASRGGVAGSSAGGGAVAAISVNGVAVTSDVDLDDAMPSVPGNAVNVKWQRDALTPNNVSANVPTGSAAGTVCPGNDARLSDARTPVAHTHAEADVTNLVADLAANTAAAHATAHKSGGGAPIRLDELATPIDTLALNATPFAHGLLPKLPNGVAKFLREDGTWVDPAVVVDPQLLTGAGKSGGQFIVNTFPNAVPLGILGHAAQNNDLLEIGTSGTIMWNIDKDGNLFNSAGGAYADLRGGPLYASIIAGTDSLKLYDGSTNAITVEGVLTAARTITLQNDSGVVPLRNYYSGTAKESQTAAVTRYTAYTTTHAGLYRVSAYFVDKAHTTTGIVEALAYYTDRQGAHGPDVIASKSLSGAGIHSLATPLTIYCTAGSIIEFATTVGLFVGTYDCYFSVEAL